MIIPDGQDMIDKLQLHVSWQVSILSYFTS